MNEFSLTNLMQAMVNVRQSVLEIRNLAEPRGAARLACALPWSIRWRRSAFGERAKRFTTALGKPFTPVSAAEEELRILLREVVKQAGRLPISEDWIEQANRVERNVDLTDEKQIAITSTRIVELHAHLMGELRWGRFYVIAPGLAWLMVEQARPFGIDVAIRFPDAARDVEASGRCLALGEWTACVFHSMRALEHGLRALAGYLGVPMVDMEQWKNVIDQIEKAIRALEAMPKGAPKTEKVQFCSEAASQFRYFKDAWRNHVSHSRASYDPRDADSIWNHAKEFMEHLAENL